MFLRELPFPRPIILGIHSLVFGGVQQQIGLSSCKANETSQQNGHPFQVHRKMLLHWRFRAATSPSAWEFLGGIFGCQKTHQKRDWFLLCLLGKSKLTWQEKLDQLYGWHFLRKHVLLKILVYWTSNKTRFFKVVIARGYLVPTLTMFQTNSQWKLRFFLPPKHPTSFL